jgi:hypothetical protein
MEGPDSENLTVFNIYGVGPEEIAKAFSPRAFTQVLSGLAIFFFSVTHSPLRILPIAERERYMIKDAGISPSSLLITIYRFTF